MKQGMSIIVRAFQLAEECASLDETKIRLSAEGYSNVRAHLSGGSIRSDLRKRFNR